MHKLEIVSIDYQRNKEHYANALSTVNVNKVQKKEEVPHTITTTSSITQNRNELTGQSDTIISTNRETKIRTTQYINYGIHIVSIWINVISLLCGIAIVILFTYQTGQLQLFTIWELLDLISDVFILVYSFNFKKIRKSHTKVRKITIRIKFHTVMCSIQILTIVALIIMYGPSQILTLAFTTISTDINNLSIYAVIVNSRGAFFLIVVNAARVLVGVIAIVTNWIYYKNACKLNITEFIKTTKERISIQ